MTFVNDPADAANGEQSTASRSPVTPNDVLPFGNETLPLLEVSSMEKHNQLGFYVIVTCDKAVWALLEPELRKQKDYEGVSKRRKSWHVYGVDRSAALRLMKFIRNFNPFDKGQDND